MQWNHLQHESYSSEAYLEGAELWYISSKFLKFSFVGFLDDIWLDVQIFVKESATNIIRAWRKEIVKESSSVRIHFVSCQNFCLWVFTLHRKMKKGKDEIICVERLSSITFEKTLTKKRWNKTSSFTETKQLLFGKKLSTSKMKKSSVKCYIFFHLFITSNSPM